MKKLMSILVLGALCWAAPVVALDRGAFQSTLTDLADGISQTAFTLSEREGSAERQAYDTVIDRTERHQRQLADQIRGIESAEDLQAALDEIRDFGAKGKLQAHTGGVALEMLKERASFLQLSDMVSGESLEPLAQEITTAEVSRASRPEQLLDRRQRSLIMVQVPVVEAVISLEDSKETRFEALRAVFARHEIRLLSERTEEKQHNYYLSGKKFVLEALMRHFKGSAVTSNLKAVMVLTTGGFWGKASIEVGVSPKPNAAETGSLGWYQAVLEKDPWKYMAENDYGKLATLGKVENIAGENKLRLKNAKLEIWVLPANGTRRDAVYFNSVEFGDVYVAAR